MYRPKLCANFYVDLSVQDWGSKGVQTGLEAWVPRIRADAASKEFCLLPWQLSVFCIHRLNPPPMSSLAATTTAVQAVTGRGHPKRTLQ